MARKLTRKQIVKQDVVKSTLMNVWEDLLAHPIRFTAIVVIFFGVLFIVLSWRYYSTHKYDTASVLLSGVLKEFSSPSGSDITGEQDQTSEESREKKLIKMEKDLNTIIRDYPDSMYVAQAQYYLGLLQLKQGRIEESIKNLKASTSANRDAITSYLAKFALGRAYLAKANYQEARNIFQELLNDQNNLVPKDYLYWELAKTYELQGNKTDSIALLQKITTEMPMSPLKSQVEAKLKKPG